MGLVQWKTGAWFPPFVKNPELTNHGPGVGNARSPSDPRLLQICLGDSWTGYDSVRNRLTLGCGERERLSQPITKSFVAPGAAAR